MKLKTSVRLKISLMVSTLFLSNISLAQGIWTSTETSGRPNAIGLDETVGANCVAYNAANNNVYSMGTRWYGLPFFPSGNTGVTEFGIVRYNSVGTVINAVENTHHTNADSVPYTDVACELITASDGSVYALGTHFFNTYWGYDIVLIKYNSLLVEQWRHYFYGPTNSNDVAAGICFDNLGNICISGQIQNNVTGTTFDFITAKINSVGTVLWETAYNTSGTQVDMPTDVTSDNAGNVYVTGYSISVAKGKQYTTIKYNSTGTRLWTKYYNITTTAVDDIANSIAVDNISGNVYVTGTGTNTSGNSDIATVCYNTSGVLQWNKKINNAGISNDHGIKVLVGPSQRVYIGGDVDRDATASTLGDLIVRKYDALGNILSTKKYNGSLYNCRFGDLAVTNSGTFYATGSCYGAAILPQSGSSLVTIKYNSSGAFQWSDILSPPQFSSCGEGYFGWKLAVNTATSEIVTGGRHFVDCPGANTEQWITRRFSPTLKATNNTTTEGVTENFQINLFPNPAINSIHLSVNLSEGEMYSVSTFNAQGQLMKTVDQVVAESDLDVSYLPSGIYFLRIKSDSKTGVLKFIKK